MTNGDSVITISKFIDDHVRFFFPEARKRLVQINRGIDTDYFNLKSVSLVRKENILKSLSIPENTHIVLLPARLTSWKGHLVAIEALNEVLKMNLDLKILMLFVGSENKGDKFTKKIKKELNLYL